jgi:hypothetical protein
MKGNRDATRNRRTARIHRVWLRADRVSRDRSTHSLDRAPPLSRSAQPNPAARQRLRYCASGLCPDSRRRWRPRPQVHGASAWMPCLGGRSSAPAPDELRELIRSVLPSPRRRRPIRPGRRFRSCAVPVDGFAPLPAYPGLYRSPHFAPGHASSSSHAAVTATRETLPLPREVGYPSGSGWATPGPLGGW